MAQGRVNFTKLIREIANEEGIDATFYSDGWGIRLEKNGIASFLIGYQFPLNNAGAKELCQDKCLTYEVLRRDEIPAVEHLFLPNEGETRSEETEAVYRTLITYIERDGAAVLKNNYGTGGHQVYRVTDKAEADETIAKIHERVYAASVSPFYEIKEEYRVILLDAVPQLTIRKERASVIVDGKKQYLTWKHNLGQGATGIIVRDEAVLRPLHKIAKAAVASVGTRFCSVDIVDTKKGLMVLEINAGVMMEHFAGQNAECYEIAKEIYRKAVAACVGGRQ